MNILTRFSQLKPSVALALLAGGSGLIYALAFTLPFPLTLLYAAIPPVDYAKLTRHTPGGVLIYVLAIAALFGLYVWAIKLTAPGSGQPPVVGGRFILIGSAMLAAVSIPAYPLTAIDLFIYAIRSRGWALYGLNPLAAAPERFPPVDPWLGLAGEWIDAPSPYGPVWEWMSLAAFNVSGGNFLAHLIALKIVAALAYLGCVWLIYRILSRLSSPWAAAGTIAFAWNPLVLLESVQNGHNDMVMVFFFLAAVWLLNERASESTSQRASNILAAPGYSFAHSPFALSLIRSFAHSLVCFLLALSVLVKFITVLAAPFLVLAMAAQQPTRPRRAAAAALYGLLIAVPVAGLMWPVWPGLDSWAVLTAGSGAGRSLLALLVLALRGAVGVNLAFDIARGLVMGLFALIYFYFLRQTFTSLLSQRSASPANPLFQPCHAAFYTLFWYVLLAAPVFHAWYLLWFMPLAVLLLPDRRALTAAVVFSFTALLAIPYFETVRVWFPVLLQNHLLGHLIGVPLLLVPPALALRQSISPKLIFEV